MKYKLFNWFAKLTGWPAALLLFRAKVIYEDPGNKRAYLKGPVVIVSNHTSIFDYVQIMFVFFWRTVRFQTAEVLYRKKGLARLLKMLGAVYVDRDAKDFGFVPKSEEILDNGGMNWDADYRAMRDQLAALMATGRAADEEILKTIRKVSPYSDEGVFDEIAKAAVEWILRNPDPVELGDVPYNR